MVGQMVDRMEALKAGRKEVQTVDRMEALKAARMVGRLVDRMEAQKVVRKAALRGLTLLALVL